MRFNVERLPGNGSQERNRRSGKTSKRSGRFFLGRNRRFKRKPQGKRKCLLELFFLHLQLECDIALPWLLQLTCANLLDKRTRIFQTISQHRSYAGRIVWPIVGTCIIPELRNSLQSLL